jgi:hypothetical protein
MTSSIKNELIEQYVALIEKIGKNEEKIWEREQLDRLEKLIFEEE